MGKKTSTSQNISVHKQELPLPNFKSFNKALNKKSFTRQKIPSTRHEEFVKKRFHLTEKLFSQEYLTNGKNCFSLARKTFSTRSKEFFLGLHVSKMVSTS